jgi:peroxiredoxin
MVPDQHQRSCPCATQDNRSKGSGHRHHARSEPFAIEFKREASSPFPVLIDMDNGYALSLYLAIWIGPDLERLLTSYGRVLPDYQANDSWTLPIPATFVVGRDGFIRARFIDPDFRRRMTVEELIDALKAAH